MVSREGYEGICTLSKPRYFVDNLFSWQIPPLFTGFLSLNEKHMFAPDICMLQLADGILHLADEVGNATYAITEFES